MRKVSIIVPVYNVESFLPECLDSVLNQGYSCFEVLLVNDGSTDHSQQICEDYAARDARIRLINQENAGAAKAKNTGLDHATGDYITFLDSDDWVEHDWLERLVRALEENRADAVECSFRKEYVGKSEAGNDSSFLPAVFTAEEYMGQYLDRWSCSLFWNKLFLSELTANIRFRRERRCIDDEFYTYKVMSRAAKIVRISDELYHYRQRRSSAVKNRNNRLQITDDALEILIERYQWVIERFPNLRDKYLRHDIEILFYFSREFDFHSITVRKLKKTARYYLLESIKKPVSMRSVTYAGQLLLMPEKMFLNKSEQEKGGEDCSLY